MSKEQEHNDWLESFLQEQTDKHRLYPSDQLWQNIQESVHGKKPWPALTIVTLAIIVALTISTLLNNHPDKQAYILKLQENQLEQQIPNQAHSSTSNTGKHYINQFSGADITSQTLQILREHNELQALLNQTAFAGQQAVANVQQQLMTIQQPVVVINKMKPYVAIIGEQMIQQEETPVSVSTSEATTEVTETQQDIAGDFRRSVKKSGTQEHDADDFLTEHGYKENPVVSKKGTPTKFSYQFWTSPSTGFRNLDESSARLLNTINNTSSNPFNSAVFTANNQASIRHRPGLGLEMGLALMYQIKPAIRIKAGIQFNLRHYLIEAFQSGYEQTDVILVRDDRTIQKLPVFTRFNNKSGFTETLIDNKLYQMAFPVGVQVDLIKGKRVGLLIDASIQPTLNLNSKLYTLTTDLNHYFDGSSLIRRWNMNSTIGLNLSYTTANQVSWQIGPQFRYQHLPTYTTAYPIKENFKDFGIKLGMLIPIRH